MEQLSHDSIHLPQHELSLVLICEVLQSPANLGSLFRLADSFGAKKLYIHQSNSDFLNSTRLKKTARQSDQFIDFELYSNFIKLHSSLIQEEFESVAIEHCETSTALPNIIFKPKTAFVIGNEISGVPDDILKKVNKVAHIDMYGKNTSMNVAQASAIALYECVKQQL